MKILHLNKSNKNRFMKTLKKFNELLKLNDKK